MEAIARAADEEVSRMAETLAAEGVTVHLFDDDIQRAFHGSDPDWFQAAAALQPTGRPIDPFELARAVAFLSSDLSGTMTGAPIDVDQAIWGAYDATPHPDAPL